MGIAVGHSHFFINMFKEFLCQDVKDDNDFARDACSQKLMNCGVAKLDLDPTRGLVGGPIVGVEPILDTELERRRQRSYKPSSHGFGCGCSSAAGQVDESCHHSPMARKKVASAFGSPHSSSDASSRYQSDEGESSPEGLLE